MRCLDKWLSWEEVQFYAAAFDLQTVPELKQEAVHLLTEEKIREDVISLATERSKLESLDILTGQPCSREGVVTRNTEAFDVDDFAANVFKYVRKGHVKTDEHWTRNWKRAKLTWERTNK